MDSSLEESSSEEEEDNKQLEDELYSVFYYNDFSKGIPETLSNKYNISFNDDKVTLCLKESNEKNDLLDSQPEEKKSVEEKQPERTKNQKKKQPERTKNRKDSRVEKCDKMASKKTGSDEEIIFIEEATVISDSGDSVVVIDDSPRKKPRYNDSSYKNIRTPLRRPEKRSIINRRAIRSAPVLISSDSSDYFDDDSDTCFDIQLNASFPPPRCYSDRSVMKINYDYKWKDVDSPVSWTSKMKKYYNKPCRDLVHFSYSEMITSMRRKGGDWFVSPLDLIYHDDRRNDLRCYKCNEFGHFAKSCDKEINCPMCGNSGHMESHCPGKLCLNCGAKRKDNFMAGCHKCFNSLRERCSICKTRGHPDYLCPDVWRRFHSTTIGEPNSNDCEDEDSRNHFCCNCASRGHLYEDCQEARWSPYPISSSFVNNYQGETDAKSEHSILLPDDLKPESDKLQKMFKTFSKKGLKLSVNSFKGLNSIFVKGKFGMISKLREDLLSLSSGKSKNKKNRKKKKKRKKRRIENESSDSNRDIEEILN